MSKREKVRRGLAAVEAEDATANGACLRLLSVAVVVVGLEGLLYRTPNTLRLMSKREKVRRGLAAVEAEDATANEPVSDFSALRLLLSASRASCLWHSKRAHLEQISQWRGGVLAPRGVLLFIHRGVCCARIHTRFSAYHDVSAFGQ